MPLHLFAFADDVFVDRGLYRLASRSLGDLLLGGADHDIAVPCLFHS